MAFHKDQTLANNHTVHALSYATSALREAASVAAGDVGKIAVQTDDSSYWILQAISPATWAPVTGGLVRCVFDATAGLIAATYGLDVEIPDNAIITRAFYEVTTPFASAASTATIALGVNTDDAQGIVAAIAINHGTTPWAAGLHDTVPDGTAANMTTKTTGEREIEAIVGVQSLTAGVLYLFFEYVVTV